MSNANEQVWNLNLHTSLPDFQHRIRISQTTPTVPRLRRLDNEQNQPHLEMPDPVTEVPHLESPEDRYRVNQVSATAHPHVNRLGPTVPVYLHASNPQLPSGARAGVQYLPIPKLDLQRASSIHRLRKHSIYFTRIDCHLALPRDCRTVIHSISPLSIFPKYHFETSCRRSE